MANQHHSAGGDIVLHKVQPREDGRLELTSEAIGDDGRIADIHSAYHDNLSPALAWTRLLEAESFALIVEDPDAPRDEPFVHWMIWNIPGTAIGLPRGLPVDASPAEPKGAVQGRNDTGTFGYFGPRPPPGHGVHRYHFQLFALDKRLPQDPNLPLPELLNALKRDTIAKAEMIGTYEAPSQQ